MKSYRLTFWFNLLISAFFLIFLIAADNSSTNLTSPQKQTDGSSMIVIIIILSIILVVGTIVGRQRIASLPSRKGVRRIDKRNDKNETSDAVERLTQVIHQLEKTLEDEKSQQLFSPPASAEGKAVAEGEMSPRLKSQPIKEGKNETATKRQKLEEYLDDDISTLVETLTRLTNEYEETYQTLCQHIADKYKQLQEASQYINAQVEKLSKLTPNDEGMFISIEAEDEIQQRKHPPKYAEAHKLAEQGIDHVEIARRTELPVGEVDLILSLSDSTESLAKLEEDLSISYFQQNAALKQMDKKRRS